LASPRRFILTCSSVRLFLLFVQLKKAKVDMVKKQKDAAAQFKTFMDLKNKELAESRKTRRKEKLEATKLESENHKLTTMMSRKIKAHQKVSCSTRGCLTLGRAHPYTTS